MIIKREPQEVTTWFLAFDKSCLTWWVRLIPGRFKHVSAFGFAERARVWVFYDVSLAQTKMVILPEGKAAIDYLTAWTEGCSILKFKARAAARTRIRLPFSCVSAMLHLLGLGGGAVLPTTLWRLLLAQGAEIVFDVIRQEQRGEGGGGAVAAAPATGASAPAAAASGGE